MAYGGHGMGRNGWLCTVAVVAVPMRWCRALRRRPRRPHTPNTQIQNARGVTP